MSGHVVILRMRDNFIFLYFGNLNPASLIHCFVVGVGGQRRPLMIGFVIQILYRELIEDNVINIQEEVHSVTATSSQEEHILD
ncbi:hypothetical protein ACJX0J_035204, partial [Zea mays]